MEAAQEEVTAQALDVALRLWAWEPPPTRAGENAGTRVEGRKFAAEMRRWLARPNHVVVTSLGKSSNNQRVDGNAAERASFKMLRFKMNPLNRDRTLVVAFNCVFEKFASRAARELLMQAAYLNGLNPFAPVVLLITADDYRDYFAAADDPDDL